MKKLLVALLVFVLVVPTVVASGPPPQGPPPPPAPPLPPVVGLKELGSIPGADFADRPVLREELAGMELSSKKLAKVQELDRSLTDEQRASIRQLLDNNLPPALGKVGDPVPLIQSVEELGQLTEAMETLLPELSRWQDAMSAEMLRILTPEQYALYQDSLLPPPVQLPAIEAQPGSGAGTKAEVFKADEAVRMTGIEPQTESDCYYSYIYAYYAYLYSYYQYIYAYYAYYYVTDFTHYDLLVMAYDAYYLDYYGYIYAYYAYYYYYNATYAYYAHWCLIRGRILEYYAFQLAYEIYYYLTGDSYSYYAYYYSYYGWLYKYYATYYAYYCYYY